MIMEKLRGIKPSDLKAFCFKRVDLQVFSIMYGVTQPEARDLLFDSHCMWIGREIFNERLSYLFGTESKRTRAEVAAEIFEEHFGTASKRFDPEKRKGKRGINH